MFVNGSSKWRPQCRKGHFWSAPEVLVVVMAGRIFCFECLSASLLRWLNSRMQSVEDGRRAGALRNSACWRCENAPSEEMLAKEAQTPCLSMALRNGCHRGSRDTSDVLPKGWRSSWLEEMSVWHALRSLRFDGCFRRCSWSKVADMLGRPEILRASDANRRRRTKCSRMRHECRVCQWVFEMATTVEEGALQKCS